MITPTIGRIVLFNDGLSDQRVPAFITYVHSDTCINIGGFDQFGNIFNSTSVILIQEEGDICRIGMAEWMMHQKKQAKKYENK